MRRAWRVAAATALLALAGCGDDDDAIPEADPFPSITTTTRAPEAGDLDIPDLPDTFAAPVPSLGFGVALPDGWQATLLSDEALERVEQARLAQPFFVESARNVASTGAVFYAAGIDDEGRVAELKIDVQEDADTSPEALRTVAEDLIAAYDLDADPVIEELEGDRLRVDVVLELESADDGSTITSHSTQVFVPDGDRLWSLIVTSEDEDTQRDLVDLFLAGFVVD